MKSREIFYLSGLQQSVIKEARTKKGWSYRDLGDRLGTSRGFISKIENAPGVTLSGERKRQLEEYVGDRDLGEARARLVGGEGDREWVYY